MDIKTDALLLRATDYGENDKIATLFTAERGKIGAAVKGVKKAGAKLKFAVQPFCFAEYVLAEKNGRYTVTSCSLHDGFYGLREDVLKFYAGAVVVDACDKLLLEGMVNGELLVCAVKALTELCAGEGEVALVRFLLYAMRLAGYPMHAGECPVCGEMPTGRMCFDMESGRFACRDCIDGVPVSEITYRTVRAVLGGEEAEAEGVRRALRLLKAYFTRKTEGELSTLDEYLALAP